MCKQTIISTILFVFIINLKAQSFPPQVGFEGSIAIHKDDLSITNWATNVTITRGYKDIANQAGGFVTFGEAVNAIGNTPNIVSLGDGGQAVLSFDSVIINGNGFDFVVFENAFFEEEGSETAFLELAFVEVSTDGVEYVRFPSVTEIPSDIQIGGFEYMNARYVGNFAGKYIHPYGTPFDLDDLLELVNGTTVNLDNINYIKLIDVVGTINPTYATHDSLDNIVNDPYPTNFISGGFDLDGIGIINSVTVGVSDNTIQTINIFPNPSSDILHISSNNLKINKIRIYSMDGKLLFTTKYKESINIGQLQKGLYHIQLLTDSSLIFKKFLKN